MFKDYTTKRFKTWCQNITLKGKCKPNTCKRHTHMKEGKTNIILKIIKSQGKSVNKEKRNKNKRTTNN